MGSPWPTRAADLKGKMVPTRFLAAIFDVDGVLVDSPHEKAWRVSTAAQY